MAFSSRKNYGHHFFPCAAEISFLHTKVCGKAPFIPGGKCPQIFLKGVRRFSTKQIECRYLHIINENSLVQWK